MAHLLLVEDNGDDEAVSIRAIHHAGRQVEISVARDGMEAVVALGLVDTHVSAAPEPPDLVLLDLKLPRMSGFAVLELIREAPNLRNVPVVVLSSSDEPSDVARCMKLGAQRYVQKPVDYRQYMTMVSGVVQEFIIEEGVQ